MMKGECPCLTRPSATSTGRLPPPAMIPTLEPGASSSADPVGSALVIAIVIAATLERRDGIVPLAATGDEIDDLHGRRRRGEFGLGEFDVLADGAGAVENRLVGLAQQVDFGARQAGPLQADDVEAAQAGAVADGDRIGNDVADNCRAAAKEGVVADAHELMNGGEPTDIDVVADLAVAAERRAIGEGGVPADNAIMGDVGIGEEIAVVADGRLAAAGIRADMHGDVFTDGAILADDQRGTPALVLGVLRRRSKRR